MANLTSRTYSSNLFQQLENPLRAYGPLVESCLSEAAFKFALALGIEPKEQFIEKKLKEMKAADPDGTARQFEYHLCDAVGKKLIVKHVQLFKKQFENTGIIKSADIETASHSIDKVFSGNGKFSSIPNAKQLLLSETLHEIEKIHQPPLQKNLAQRFFSPLSMLYSKSPDAILAENKIETIKQVKQLMGCPMLATTAPLWGENEEWDNPEPIEFTMPLECGGISSDSDSELETPSIYPQLQKLETQPIKSGNLYPPLSEINPLSISSFDTDPSEKHHARVSYVDLAFPGIALNRGGWDFFIHTELKEEALRHYINIQIFLNNKGNPHDLNSYPANVCNALRFCIDFQNKFGTDLNFDDLLDQDERDSEAWNSLPAIVQKDVLRHCIHLPSCHGAAEELACRLFKEPEEFELQLKLCGLQASPVKTGLSEQFIKKGEALLQLYYSNNDPLDFIEQFSSLPKEARFLQYVYEMAKAAGVQIESWDHRFAENNFMKIQMIGLSVQALERCLHTKGA